MFLLALALASVLLQGADDAPGYWPQWRGPNRDNISAETGLLKEWPEGGPTLLWSTTELGDGMPPVSVAGGRIYGLGFKDGKAEYLTSLDGKGRVVWSVPVGPLTGEMPMMRFLNQRPVSVDDDRLYAFMSGGTLVCLRTLDGKLLWKQEYAALGAGRFTFFACDTPMVDGPNLICKPGGTKGQLAALDKINGKLLWQSSEFTRDPSHSPIVPAEIDGVRQYVVRTMDRVAGIAAQTGKLLWSAECRGVTAIACTPIVRDGIVFVSAGYNIGCHAFRVALKDGAFQATPLYSGRQLESHHGDIVLAGDFLYGTNQSGLQCVDFRTGEVRWTDRCVGRANVTYADGHLLVRSDQGIVALVEASPAGYKETGRLVPPQPIRENVLHAVVTGGRLYLRDPKTLYCYDLRGSDYKEPPVVSKSPGNAPAPEKNPTLPPRLKTDAAFVPTPRDVVKRMLELAKVGKNDVVVDLGSGDGRIVLAAARDYGCKAVGYEIEPELVKKSREEIAKAKLESLATIEEKDLFTVDLSGATVVTLYLGAPNNARLLPQLRKLPPRSRIVSHQHRLGEAGPEPDERVIVVSNDDPDPHVIYLWTTPLKEGK
jgi:prepilin-type processing-associated H-X9-DG protein